MKVNYTPERTAKLFQDHPENWWIAGGWATDLFLGEQTREHEDVDVAILRSDEQSFRARLQDWELWPGPGNSQLEDNPIALGERLAPDRKVIWCRPSATSQWAFEFLLNKNDGEEWVFKRDDRIRRPIADIGNISPDGIPYLNPEIVLLYKAKNLRGRDEHDFQQVLPKLGDDARSWLGDSLRIVHPDHPWVESLQV